jgi:very-short-patch-repair endonuclease
MPNHLARAMRSRGLAFRRQSAIGAYIADFECRKAKLVIEVDGAQHDQGTAREYDEQRSKWLASQGYRVLRLNTTHTKTPPSFDGGVSVRRVKTLHSG